MGVGDRGRRRAGGGTGAGGRSGGRPGPKRSGGSGGAGSKRTGGPNPKAAGGVGAKHGSAGAKTPRTPSRPAAATPATPPPPRGPFRLGAIPGATPGKWIDAWRERMPETALDLIPLAVAEQRDALAAGTVDAALVRLPIDRDGLHVIPLYDEVPVVVCSVDSHLTAADELTLADLAGEVVITPADDVLGVVVPDAVPPIFAAPASTEEAIGTVAAGVGVVIVPMSLARLHHRKDVEHRPLSGGPASSVALAWPADGTSPLVDVFVGIVRGRTANSSRG